MKIRVIKLDAQESGIACGDNDVLEGVLKVSFPNVGALVVANKFNNSVEIFVLDADKGRVDAFVDGRQLRTRAAGVRKVIDRTALVAVRFRHDTHG